MLTMNDAQMPLRQSTNAVAQEVGLTRQTLYKWAKNGAIKINRDNKGHYIWDQAALISLKKHITSHSSGDAQRNHPRQQTSLRTFSIGNRRYLGSKTRLLPFIQEVVNNHTVNVTTVADIFAGTGSVADMFRRHGAQITVNDILASNAVVYSCFFGAQHVRSSCITNWINEMNALPGHRGYVTHNYGDGYFSVENAMKIDSAREYIEAQRYISSREKNILLTSLIYGLDKIANTVGHYDAYRKVMDSIEPIHFLLPDYKSRNRSTSARIYQEDANKLVRKLDYNDLIYIDTPYNSRQYGDTYHVLENIVLWKKPKLYGVSRKAMDRSSTRSLYCTTQAGSAFDDLIQHLNTRYILVSYNNMAKKGNGRSNAKISDEEMRDILSKRGKLQIFSTPFHPYTTGKTHLKDHREYLYLVDTEE